MAKHKKFIENTLRTGIQTRSIDDIGIRLLTSRESPLGATAPVNPGTFSGLLQDLDFQDPAIQALSNGTAISSWGGATQATVGKQPTKQATGVLFDGVDDAIVFTRRTNVLSVIWVGHFTSDNDNWAPILSDSLENPFHGGGSGGGSAGKLVQIQDAAHLKTHGVKAYVNGQLVNIGTVLKPIGTPIILVVNYVESDPANIEGIGSQALTDPSRYFNGTVKRAMLFDRNLTDEEIIGAVKHLGDLYSLSYNVDAIGEVQQVEDAFQLNDPDGNLLSKLDGTGHYNGLIDKLKKGDARQYDADPTVLIEWQDFGFLDQKWIGLVSNPDVDTRIEAWMGIQAYSAQFGGWGQAELQLMAKGQQVLSTNNGQIDFRSSWGTGLTFPGNGSTRFMLGDVDQYTTGRFFAYGSDDTDEFILHGPLNLHGHRITNFGDSNVAGAVASIETTVKPVRLAVVGAETQDWIYSEYGWIRTINSASDSHSSPFNIDGVPIVDGDLVLVNNRANAWENGLYFVHNSGGFWGMERTADFNLYLRSGLTVGVREGVANGGKAFISRLAGPDTETGFFNGQVEPFPNTLVIEFTEIGHLLDHLQVQNGLYVGGDVNDPLGGTDILLKATGWAGGGIVFQTESAGNWLSKFIAPYGPDFARYGHDIGDDDSWQMRIGADGQIELRPTGASYDNALAVKNPYGPSGGNGDYTFAVNPSGQLWSRDLHTEDHAYIGGSVFTNEIRAGGDLLRMRVNTADDTGKFQWNNGADATIMELSDLGVLDLKTHKIKNVMDPVDPQDAATKAYTDALVAGISGGPASLGIYVEVPVSFDGTFTAHLPYGADLSPLTDGDGNLKISALEDTGIDAGTFYWTDADPVYGMVFRYNNDVNKTVFLSEIIAHFQSVVPHSRVQLTAFSGDAFMSDLTAVITPGPDAEVGAELLHLDGTDQMYGQLNMGGFRITNLNQPFSAQDAATKGYVDVGAIPTLTTPPGSPSTGQKWLLFTSATEPSGNKFGDVQLPEMTGFLNITVPEAHQLKAIIWYGDNAGSISISTSGDDAGFVYWEVTDGTSYGDQVADLNAAIFAEYGLVDAVTFTVPADADIIHTNAYTIGNFYVGTGSSIDATDQPRLMDGTHKFAQKMTIEDASRVHEVVVGLLSQDDYTPDGILTLRLCPDLGGIPYLAITLATSAPIDLSTQTWPGLNNNKGIYTVFETAEVVAGTYWLVLEFTGHTAGTVFADSLHVYSYADTADKLYYYDGATWTDTTYTLSINSYNSTDEYPMVLFPEDTTTESVELFFQGSEGDLDIRVKVPTPTAMNHATPKYYVDTYVTDAIAAIDFDAVSANKTLSNLTSPTSINQDLIPATDGSRSIGSGAKAWSTIFANLLISKAGQSLSLQTNTDDAISIQSGGSAELKSAFSSGKSLELYGNDYINMATTGYLQLNGQFQFYANADRTLKVDQNPDPGVGRHLTIEAGLSNSGDNAGGILTLRGGLGQGTQAAFRNKIVLDGGFVQVGTGTGSFTEGAPTDNSFLMNSDADVVTRLSMRSSDAEAGFALGNSDDPHLYGGAYTGKFILYASPLYNAAALNFNGGFEIGNVLSHNNVISDTLLHINGYQHANDFFKVDDTVLGDIFAIGSDGNVNVYDRAITNVGMPVGDGDAANKAYVDSLFAGLDPKASVRVATTANITLSGEQTIDGVAAVTGDRVLVKDQTAGEENGIYVVDSGAWGRSADADGTPSNEVSSGMYCFVSEGTLNFNKFFFLATPDPIVVDTTVLVFSILAIAPTVLSFNKYNRTLDSTDITNQYIDLPHEVKDDSLDVIVAGLWMEEGDDYTLSLEGGVTRITFAGDLATGGATPLVATDRILTRYAHE